MTPFRVTLLTTSFAVAVCAGAVQSLAQGPAAAPAKPMMTLQMPAQPEPAKVTLDPAKTGLLVLDYVEGICKQQPKCTGQMLPAFVPFMAKARKAGVTVAYGTREQNMSKWLPEIAPMAGDIKIVNTAQDRFYNTDLDKELKAKGVATLILAGWKVSGSVAYSSLGATLRDFTVVVPVDTTAATSDYETTIGFYQILNAGNANLANTPLKPKSTTLSRTDLITFQ
jgi:nicotinamidase-related amidase